MEVERESIFNFCSRTLASSIIVWNKINIFITLHLQILTSWNIFI